MRLLSTIRRNRLPPTIERLEARNLLAAALARGMADYRIGEIAGAIEWCNKSLSPGAENPIQDGLAQAFLAMAHHRLGQADGARRALEKARALEQKLPKLEAGDQSWPDVLRLHIVRREAEALLMNEKSGISKKNETKSPATEP
jgi:tetratricopeptide (TPR) repeat protein